MRFLRIIAHSVTNIISYFIPINKHLLVFVSYPDFGDNSYAVFRYMIKSNVFNRYKFCWLVNGESTKNRIMSKVEEWGGNISNVTTVKRKSLKGIFCCYRAKYIFNTVGVFTDIKFHQKNKRINMWHGMPIKKISSETQNGDITVATSDLFKPLMSDGLKIPEDKVLVIGQPRNDLLFCPEELCQELKELITKYRRVGIWLPTFRRSSIDNKYKDGTFKEDYIAFLSFSELDRLNRILKDRDILLIIKFHPMDVIQFNEFQSYTNIAFLRNDNFNQNNLYPLLAGCDFLISDYSSVIIDFEILNRPIGITINDMDEYKHTRGLNFENIPGIFISNLQDLKKFITSIESYAIDLTKNEPEYIFNKYKDNHSSERLIECLDL